MNDNDTAAPDLLMALIATCGGCLDKRPTELGRGSGHLARTFLSEERGFEEAEWEDDDYLHIWPDGTKSLCTLSPIARAAVAKARGAS